MIRFLIAALLTLVFWSGSPTQGAADPASFVREVSGALNVAAQTAKTSGAEAGRAEVEAVLTRYFDVAAMAVAALPKALQGAASPAYVAAYCGYLAKVFVRETLRAGDGELAILGARKSGALTLVGSQVTVRGTRGRVVEWYLAARGGSYAVVNASVESVLITQQNRRDFADVLAAEGLPGLIERLQKGAL